MLLLVSCARGGRSVRRQSRRCFLLWLVMIAVHCVDFVGVRFAYDGGRGLRRGEGGG